MLSCNGIVLNYEIVMYDKPRSKIQIACGIANELPAAPTISYFLCDCWYSCVKVMDSFLRKCFYTVGTLKINRATFPSGIRQQVSQFAQFLQKRGTNVNLATVGKRQYYVFCYESSPSDLKDAKDAVVLISCLKDAFWVPNALRTFICTNTSLTTQDILERYLERWPIEVFFRQAKQKPKPDKYQIRSACGIRRFWLLMSLAHFICCMGTGKPLPLQEGFSAIQAQLCREQIRFIYQCGVSREPLANLLSLAA